MSEPGPVEEDILIDKLRPGHELEMRLFAVKVRVIILIQNSKETVARDWVWLKNICQFFFVILQFYSILAQISLVSEGFFEFKF